MIKTFRLIAGISLAAFIISVFLHNAISGLFGIEEPVFFFIAVIIAPLAFAVGLIVAWWSLSRDYSAGSREILARDGIPQPKVATSMLKSNRFVSILVRHGKR